MNLYNKKKLIKFFSYEKNFSSINILSIIIIFCSFKLFGYAIGFIFLTPYLYFNRDKFFLYLKDLDLESKLVIGYFLYFIFQSIIGSYNLKDVRILLYWPIFFSFCLFSYLYNKYKFREDIRYNTSFENIVFNSSIIYFIVYFFMNIISFIIYQNEYDIQSLFWVGGSTSFNISCLFLYTHYKKWNRIQFKLYSKYSLLILLYTFLILLNESRFGQLYLLFFLFFALLKGIKIKKHLNIILITILCFYTFSFGSNIINVLKININDNFYNYKSKTLMSEIQSNVNSIKNLKSDPLSGDRKRIEEIRIGFKAYENVSTLKKIFGTGWYSSRVTITETRNEFIDKYTLPEHGYKKNEINHLQGIISLLLDTGGVGILYTLILFSLNLWKTIKSKSEFINKLFYLFLILTNFLCLFIGYPWVSIPFFLMLLPGGFFLLESNSIK